MQVIEFPAASTTGTARNEAFVAHTTVALTIAALVTAGFGAVAMGFWRNSDSNSITEMSSVARPTTPATISILEIHNQAHLEFLPIQEIEDQSVIYSKVPR